MPRPLYLPRLFLTPLLAVGATLAGCASPTEGSDIGSATSRQTKSMVTLTLTSEESAARAGARELQAQRERDAADAFIKNNAAMKYLIADPVLSVGKIAKNSDSTFTKTLTLNTSNKQVSVMSGDWMRRELGASILAADDAKNLRKLYAQLYALPSTDKKRFANPLSLAGASLADLRVAVKGLRESLGAGLAGSRLEMPSRLAVAYSEPDCASEVGYELGLDTKAFRAWKTGGIMNAVDFTLRGNLNCVRDQATRGTCAAFAISSAFEVLQSRAYGERYNLSEQNQYWWAETFVDGDGKAGLPTTAIMLAMESEDFSPSLESTWNYNPSTHRDSTAGEYADVCVGYTESSATVPAIEGAELCTESLTQGNVEVVVSSDPLPSAEVVYSAPGVGTGKYMRDVTSFWDATNTSNSTTVAALFARAGYPVVVSISTDDGWDSPSDGYIAYTSPPSGDRGGHAVTIVGFVRNVELPAGAPRGGSDVGYFVIRNSWGTDYADNGYVYAPFEWVRDHSAGARTFIVEED